MNAKEFAEKYKGRKYKDGNQVGFVVGYQGGNVIVGFLDMEGWTNVTGKDVILTEPFPSYGYRNPDVKYLVTEEGEEKKVLTPTLKEDYMRRFKDIKNIIVNNDCSVVILKTGEKGVAKVEPGELVDERVGILEAYIKAIKLRTSIPESFTPRFIIPHFRII